MREGLGWFSRSGRVGSVSERESVVLVTLRALLFMSATPPSVQSSHQGASHSTYAAKLKPRWDVHLSGDDDQLG